MKTGGRSSTTYDIFFNHFLLTDFYPSKIDFSSSVKCFTQLNLRVNHFLFCYITSARRLGEYMISTLFIFFLLITSALMTLIRSLKRKFSLSFLNFIFFFFFQKRSKRSWRNDVSGWDLSWGRTFFV